MNRLSQVLLLSIFLLCACGHSGDKEKTTDESRNAKPVTTRYKPEKSGKIVARVNGVPIYEDELKGSPVNSLVTDEILYQQGLKEGIDKKYQDKVIAYQMNLVLHDIKSNILSSMPPEKVITDEELLDYYNKIKDLNYTNIRIQEINFTDKDLGERILKLAEDGKQLQNIADTLSKSGSKLTVTDLGFDRLLSQYFKVKEVGALTGVIDKKDGTYSVLKITEVRQVPFDNIKGVLMNTVESMKKGAAIDNYAAKKAKENGMKIEIIKNTGQ